MRRFFLDPEAEVGEFLSLSKRQSHHLQRVLRLPPGTALQLLDGKGSIYDGEIAALGKQVEVYIYGHHFVPQDAVSLQVCQSLLKGQKMELLIQKCTELGVTEFTPFHSERSQIKKKELVKIRAKYDRWQRIIEEACKQCGTPWAMKLNPLLFYEEIVRMQEDTTQKILFWEEEATENSLHSSPVDHAKTGVQMVFGPEGGFPKEEVDLARGRGFRVLSLGKRILKAETANIAAVAIVQHMLGNM